MHRAIISGLVVAVLLTPDSTVARITWIESTRAELLRRVLRPRRLA